MNFDKLNKIQVTKDEMDKLMLWKDANKDLVQNYKQPFDDGVIIIDNTFQLVFKHESSIVHYYWYARGDLLVKFDYLRLTSTVQNFEATDKHPFIKHMIEKMGVKEFTEYSILDMLAITSTILAYMTNYKAEVRYRHEIIHKSGGTVKSKRKKATKVINITRAVYMLNVPSNLTTIKEKRDYERHIDAWSVRGHWRTYESGKKVWVKPHNKGASSHVEPKIYRI